MINATLMTVNHKTLTLHNDHLFDLHLSSSEKLDRLQPFYKFWVKYQRTYQLPNITSMKLNMVFQTIIYKTPNKTFGLFILVRGLFMFYFFVL